MNLLERAKKLADWWHKGINRKTSGPYIIHPANVAALIKDKDEVMQAAAWLHDVIEDPNASKDKMTKHRLLELLISKDGMLIGVSIEKAVKVVGLVEELTNVYTKEAFPTLDRKTRKIFELARLEQISADAQTIKVADIIDNTKDLEELGDFGAKYLIESQDKLSVLTRACPKLLERAENQLKRYVD